MVGQVNVNDLLADPPYLMGTLKGHEVLVSIDDFEEALPLGDWDKRETGLAISAFVDNGKIKPAALARAVLLKLQQVSPQDAQALLTLLGRKHAAGEVIAFRVPPGPEIDKRFPFLGLYIALFEEGEHVSTDALDKVLPKLVLKAGDDGIENLFIPAIGTTWNKRQELEIGDFYKSFFSTLPQSSRPSRIDLSLYKRWPSFEIEGAAQSINLSWQDAFSLGKQRTSLVHHDIRTLLLFIAVALWASSRKVHLGTKTFLVITFFFGGIGLAVNAAIRSVAATYPSVELPANLFVLTVAALVYPMVVTWNPKDIFGASAP
ncbi:hypothetical protein GCM10009107_05130 [Ideonella azotifigens]|uniref:CHASE2 domain-containing protein n=1 Tax=Ideonella azotifigens TaxID=513160 RepID=A0ABP3UTC4_9BURK